MSRRRPKLPDPVTAADGTRYETWGGYPEFNREHGVIAAFAPGSTEDDEPLWALRVYETQYDGRWEKDNQDVFIIQLRLEDNDSRLIVLNERKRTFVVELASRTVLERFEAGS